MKHNDVNQALVDSLLGETARTNDYYGSLKICEVLYQFFYVQVSISQAANFWKWKCKDTFRSPYSVNNDELVDAFVEYLEYMNKQHEQNKDNELVQKWTFLFKDVKNIQRKPSDWPQSLKPMCPECGLDLSNPMGYVCPSTRCPTGLSGPTCKF